MKEHELIAIVAAIVFGAEGVQSTLHAVEVAAKIVGHAKAQARNDAAK